MYSLERFPDLYLYPSRRDQKVTEDRTMLGSGPLTHPHGVKARLQECEKPGVEGCWCRDKFFPLLLKKIQEVFEESEFQTMRDMLRAKPPPNNSRGHCFINYVRQFLTQTHQGISCGDRWFGVIEALYTHLTFAMVWHHYKRRNILQR